MPEDQVIRYFYENSDMTTEAVNHVFKYLSAFGNCRFIEDRDAPEIWRGDGNDIPASAKLIISKNRNSNQPSSFDNELQGKWIISSVDPIERILRKTSLKFVTGPYSESEFEPVNDPDESLAGMIKAFYSHLQSAGLLKDNSDAATFWPKGSRFGAALSHDVDMVHRSVKGSVRLLLKNDVPGGMKGLSDSVISSLGLAKNPYDRIPGWLKLESELGIKSTFFIFPGYRTHENDPKYKLNDLDKSIRQLKDNGFGLGLHTGIECYKGEKITESAGLLGRFSNVALKGIRPHYLSASFPEYWRAAAECGFEYSSSLGFDNDIGFFDGIDLPFIPFDMESNEAINIVEIPIGIMDCGLLGDRGEKMNGAIENGKALIEKSKKTGGILVIDWHQRTMYQRDYPGWVEILIELIDYARHEGAYFITLEEVAERLRDRLSGNK